MKKTFTDIEGVYSSGIHSGIKLKRKDLSYIFVPHAMGSAAVFTQNQFCASSVSYSKKCFKKNLVKAVIINSGNANAGTGAEGEKDTRKMASLCAKGLGLNVSEVAVASTGIIGTALPMDKIESGISTLFNNPLLKDGDSTAEAILTTDKCSKTVFSEKKIGKKTVVVAGITKGSGMLAPNMATTLTFLVTNLSISSDQLQPLFSEAINNTFNMMSVDTDTSTNDMALIFSTGQYKIKLTDPEHRKAYSSLLEEALVQLVRQNAADGEGATKLIEVCVVGAATRNDARKIAKNVVESPLVKTAIYGSDPNWGRVIAAAGKDPNVKLNVNKVDLHFSDTPVFIQGNPVVENRNDLVAILEEKEIKIVLNCNLGKASAIAWGCDLTHGYIDINTAYS